MLATYARAAALGAVVGSAMLASPALAAVDPAATGKVVVVGTGTTEDTGRPVVRTAAGQVYVFAADDTPQRLGNGPGVVRAWKGNQTGVPTAFAEVDGVHRPVAAGTSDNVLVDVDARLDGAGTVHVTYVDETSGSLVYRTFSTATDTWAPAVTVATDVNVPDGFFKNLKRAKSAAALTLDSGDVPHVVWVSGASIYTSSRAGGTWSAPRLVTSGGSPVHPQLAYGPDGTLWLSWLENDPTRPAVMVARQPPLGAWSAPETVASGAVEDNSTGDQGPSIAVSSSGKPYVLWITPRAQDAVRVAYRTSSGWVADPLPTDLYSHAPQVYVQGDDVYAVLGHDSLVRLGYEAHLSGQPWSPYVPLTTQADGTLDGSASVRWDPPRETDASVIDAVFYDEDTRDDGSYLGRLYYAAIASGRATAPADTAPPAVALTAPPSGSSVSGTVVVTADASDDVGVAGVRFLVDGVALGAEDTSAPYSVAWDSSTAANGSHTLTAVARDAAGHSTTATEVVTVLNAAPQPPPPSAGLVAAYSFDAGSGSTAADASGLGNTGTLTRTTWSAAGKHGGALSFDGSSSWVTIPDAPSLDLTSGMTIEAWVKPTALGSSWRTVAFKERTGGMVYSLYANQGTGLPVGQVEVGGEQNAAGASSPPLNAWTHLATTFDGSSLRLYVDGSLVRTTAVSGAMAASTGALRLGGNGIWPEWYAGLLDDVRVYSRALSASEIQADMATGVGDPPPPPPPPADTTAPTVSIASPASGATVAGDVAVAASAADDVGVAGVQFRLDGAALGAEDTTAPYSVTWSTPAANDGAHTLTAVARDAAGNTTTSAPVTVTVSNAPPPPGPGLVAAYSFDQGTGTSVPDASGNRNDGVAANTSWTTAGKHGGALTFNGSSSSVAIPDSPSLDLATGMTLEAWVKPSALSSSWRTVLFKERPGGMAYALYAHNGTRPTGQVDVGGAEQNATGSSALATGSWTHLAVTYDGATLRLFVNGSQAGTRTVAGSITQSGGVLRIGGNSIWPEWFAGQIDDVRVYDRALSAAEIASDMNAAVTP